MAQLTLRRLLMSGSLLCLGAVAAWVAVEMPAHALARVQIPAGADGGRAPTCSLNMDRHSLEHRHPAIHFNAVTLRDAMDFFADLLENDLWVDWHALAAAGVPHDKPITLKTDTPHTIRQFLEQVLKLAGGDKLAMGLHGQVVLISTPERLKVVQRVLAEADKRANAPGAFAKLAKTHLPVKLVDVKLLHVIEFFADVLPTSLEIQWNTLEQIQITPETLTNLDLRNCTLTEVVALIFLSHPGGEAVTLTGGDDGLRIGVAEKP